LFWNKIKSRLPEIIIFSAVIFLQFYRLGLGEIQSHDESRYIMRAEACLRFGAWLDQTQYAIGGLFSSTHPPLIVWMMALMRFLFGSSSFVSRLVSPIAAIFALYYFYRLTNNFFSRSTALFATAALGVAQHFLWYSHHGQFDIPMFAFIVAASYYAIRSFEEENSKLAVIAGILFGCVLLSKAVQGLYLLPFICSLVYVYPSDRKYKNLMIVLGVFLITALPWYIFMLARHVHFYGDYAGLIASLKTNSYAEGATKSAWWFYINQTVINFPLIVLSIAVIVPLWKQWKTRDTPYKRLCIISFIWFIGMLVSLSNFYTRMLHFSLFLLLPTSLVLCFSLEEFFRNSKKTFILIVGCILLIPALTWSMSEILRMSFKEHFLYLIPVDLALLIVSIAVAISIFIVLYKYFSASSVQTLILISVIFLITTDLYRWGSRRNETFVDGAEAVGNILLHTSGIHSLTAYQDGVPFQYMLPQLNYYSGCWLVGWDSTKTGVTKTWHELDSLIKINNVPLSDASVLYVSWDGFYTMKPAEKELLARLNYGLAERYEKSLHTKKYQLYWQPKK
jgi:4-amino-4-deoxy-L-arabinose transferase-like glycosyltransferase